MEKRKEVDVARVITGLKFLEALQETMGLPPHCCRVIIDAPFDNAVKIYYECYGDETLLEVDFTATLRDAPAIQAKDMGEPQHGGIVGCRDGYEEREAPQEKDDDEQICDTCGAKLMIE